MSVPGPSKVERLQEFYRRLGALPAASNFAEAWSQIGETLNAVENELSGIQYDPARWKSDGRLYPPQLDSERVETPHPKVRRFRSVAHNTLIGENGSIEIIQTLTGQVVFSKPGADGRRILEQ
jgi:hypothetical protein